MRLKLHLFALATIVAAAIAETPSDTANFNVLHGNAYYTTARTPGEAPSVLRNLYTPYLMYGNSLVYLAPSDNQAVASYASGEHTSFFAYLNSRAMLGIATKSFGFSFSLDLDEKVEFFDEKDAYHKDERTSVSGHGNEFTFRFSLPFQTTDFLATLRYSQYNDSLANVEYADSEGKIKKEYHSHDHYISGSVTFTNKPSAKDFSWSTGGTAARNIETVKTSLKSSIDPNDNYKETRQGTSNYIYASFFYNFGYIVLQSANARVHVGNNTSVNAYIYDRVKDNDNRRKDFYIQSNLYLTPHILAEYAFNENWMIWGGSYYTWSNSFNREEYQEAYVVEDEDKDFTVKNYLTQISTKTNTLGLSTGLLFKYKQLILEASIQSALYRNPFRGFDGGSMLMDFSGTVTF